MARGKATDRRGEAHKHITQARQLVEKYNLDKQTHPGEYHPDMRDNPPDFDDLLNQIK